MNCGMAHPSSNPWASSLYMVPKSFGYWRPRGDHCALNKAIVLDIRHSIPNIHYFTNNLSDGKVSSEIDLMKEYYQILMTEEDTSKMAIRTLFDLCNAAQASQHFIDELFRGVPFTFSYIDAILVASTSPTEYAAHLLHRRLHVFLPVYRTCSTCTRKTSKSCSYIEHVRCTFKMKGVVSRPEVISSKTNTQRGQLTTLDRFTYLDGYLAKDPRA